MPTLADPDQAAAADLPAIIALLGRAIEHLHANGIMQWSRGGYPEQRLAGDIASGSAWMWRQAGSIVAYGVVDQAQEAQWEVVPFRDRSGRHRCVHRFMVDPSLQGRGIGSAIMSWVEARGRAQGWTSIRLDAFAGNPISNRLYQRRGYQEVGRVRFGPIEGVVYELLIADPPPRATR